MDIFIKNNSNDEENIITVNEGESVDDLKQKIMDYDTNSYDLYYDGKLLENLDSIIHGDIIEAILKKEFRSLLELEQRNIEVSKKRYLESIENDDLDEISLFANVINVHEILDDLILNNKKCVVEFLVDNGWDVNDYGIMNPLTLSVGYDNMEISEFFIKNGSNIDPREGELISPLSIAVRSDNIRMVKLLIESGADFTKDIIDLNGTSTPLMIAHENGYTKIVKYIEDSYKKSVKVN